MRTSIQQPIGINVKPETMQVNSPLLDKFSRPLRDLRISLTDRCNFRCSYCMPAEVYGERYEFLPRPELLTFEEIVRLVRIFVKLGVTKLRLTGGEPLMRQNICELVEMLSNISGVEDLTLTTNGYLLSQNARALREAGLQRITVSLDTLDAAIFQKMNGLGLGISKVLEGIQSAQDAGFDPIKINAVVQKGVNDHTIVDLARYAREHGHLVRFIEYMDVGNRNGWKLDHVVPSRDIVNRIDAIMPLDRVEKDYRGEVADKWRYADGSGEIGVISSVTEPFCGACTRARLSPDGHVFTCLFASSGYDLKVHVRGEATDNELESRIRNLWGLREDRYSEIRTSLTGTQKSKVEMYHIGG